MKKKITKLKACLASGLMLLGFAVDAQLSGSYVFPQNTSYAYGQKPSSASSTDALNSYNYWKTNFVTSSGACGYRRVIWDYYSGGRGATDKSSTVSEGIGYGMLLSAYAGDQSLFSDLWNYYQVNENSNGVMNWEIQNCSVVGANGATDADLDVAMALVVASYQWQSNTYLSAAQKMISTIRNKEFSGNILKPGDQFGGSNLVNPSYFSPAYYKVFATIEPAYSSFWNAAVTEGYAIINAADKNKNGLVPDWCDATGSLASAASSYEDQGQHFIYDAIRTPFRSAIDALWFGSTDGAKYCTRLIDWAYNNNSGGTESLGSKYDITGSKLDASHSNTFVGCFTVAAMAADASQGGTHTNPNYLSFLNRGYTDNQNTSPGYGQYFNATFKVLSQFVLTGNFYLPPPDKCTAPNLGSTVSLCKTSPVVLNSNIAAASGVTYVWSMNGTTIGGATSSTYSASAAGTYQVVVNQNGCVRRSFVVVEPSAITADFSYSVQASQVNFTNTSSGASNYTWTYKLGTGTATSFGTSRDTSHTFLTAGSYTITMTVTNTAFGCAGTATTTKTVVVGGGAGWVADDFNDHTYSEPWVANTTNYNALPVTYCSAADAKLGGTPKCSNLPCSYYEVKCIAGAGAQYNPFGINLRANDAVAHLNIKSIPYVSMKIRSTAAVNLGVGLNDSILTCNRNFVSIPANKDTIVNLDFSTYLTGYLNASNPSYALNYGNIQAIQFFPYEKVPTFTGTIDIDWIIIGGKSLPAPEFNLKKDANGYLVYENANGDGKTYVTVPDWAKKVTSCSATTALTANACTAATIKWFSGASQIGTGSTVTVGPGTYTVQLINLGGVTTDTVVVTASNTTADFNIDRLNYDVHFTNNSTGYQTFTWAYGDVANDIAGSTTWDIGYHNYKKAGKGTYPVVLTVKDTVCNITKTKTINVVIACDSLVSKPVFTTVDSVGCAGDKVTIKIAAVPNATGVYGWFGPTGTTFTKTVGDTLLSRDVVFGSTPGPLSVQAYNDCGQAATTVNLKISTTPVSTFLDTPTGVSVAFSATHKGIGDIYAWTFGDLAAGTSTLPAPTYVYAKAGTYNACLTVSNTCGAASQVCQTVNTTSTGIVEIDKNGGLMIYPTISSTEITIRLAGTSTVKVVDLLGAVLSTHTMVENETFDVSGLASGIYFFNIQQGTESVSKKFIIQ